MNHRNTWYKPTKLRPKIILTLLVLFMVRLCSNIPIPLINQDYLSTLFSNNEAFSFIDTMSGGSFTNMTLMALGVTPYITASIILQLLTIAIPKLEDIQNDGEHGRKKWEKINIIVGLVLGFIQALGMAYGFGKQGLLNTYNAVNVLDLTVIWTLGCALIIAAGTYISKCGIGNGISLILAINIISGFPSDILAFYEMYLKDESIANISIRVLLFLVIVICLIAFTILLNNAEKEIEVIYPNGKNNKMTRSSKSNIPIKLNTAGVMPVIFTSTLYSLPIMFLSNSTNSVAQELVKFCSSQYWFDLDHWWRTLGLVVYFLLMIFFAYFYTSISFNPMMIANQLKKSGACIPGIRPGKPTEEYLTKQIKYVVFLGATFLFILTEIPTMISIFTNMTSLSFGGTSIIIVVGVIQETTLTIKAENLSKSYVKDSKFLGLSTKKGIMAK